MPIEAIVRHLADFFDVLRDLKPSLIYIHHPDLYGSLDETHQKRGDFWHKGETAYFTESPYGVRNNLRGFKGYVELYEKLKEIHFMVMEYLNPRRLIIDRSLIDWELIYKKIESFLQLKKPANTGE